MNNEEVVKDFLCKKEAFSNTRNLSSTGNRLFSYSTCIAEYNKDGILYINLTKYSRTTSHHQSILLAKLSGINYKLIYNIEYNKVHIVPKDEEIVYYNKLSN